MYNIHVVRILIYSHTVGRSSPECPSMCDAPYVTPNNNKTKNSNTMRKKQHAEGISFNKITKDKLVL